MAVYMSLGGYDRIELCPTPAYVGAAHTEPRWMVLLLTEIKE